MKKYQTKPEVVEACQFTGTKKSFDELRTWIGEDIYQSYQQYHRVFLHVNLGRIEIKGGSWIVKRPDLEGDFGYIVMRDDQFHERYGVLEQVTTC